MRKPSAFMMILLLVFCAGGQPRQDDLSGLVEKVIARARATSMYSASTHWDALGAQVRAKAANARTVKDLRPAFTALIDGLRDHHARIFDAADRSMLAYFTDYKNLRHVDKRPRPDEVWKIVNDTKLRFDYRLLDGRIGYLKIVGIGPDVDVQKESEAIRKAVIELAEKKKARGWMVDLRYNGGGNMYPMMAGLAPLIGDGKVGKLVTAGGETLFDWTIDKGAFVYDALGVVSLPNRPVFRKLPRVAVLTSRWTASSGELVATTLKGRADTRFFGEATAGYTTNTGWDTVDEKVILVISTGIFSDRRGVAYPNNIPVDVEIPFEPSPDPSTDNCAREAAAWLRER